MTDEQNHANPVDSASAEGRPTRRSTLRRGLGLVGSALGGAYVLSPPRSGQGSGRPASFSSVASHGSMGLGEPAFLLSIFLRGGADGLTLVAPSLDPDYKDLRSTTQVWNPDDTDPTKVAAQEGLKLTEGVPGMPDFCVPPALQPFHAMFTAPSSKLALFHACGNADPAQSHFEAQRLMEFGTSNMAATPLNTGWIGRHLATKQDHLMGAPGTFRAISYSSTLALGLAGGPGATPVPNPPNYGFPISFSATPAEEAARAATLNDLYGLYGAPLDGSMASIIDAVATLEGVDFTTYSPQGMADYPATQFGTQLRHVAQLAKEVGSLEVVHANLGGWDTHEAQGVFVEGGRMHDLMVDLAGSVKAFHDDMSAYGLRKFVVVVVTEFGRTVRENSSDGTDHGRGGVAAVCGSDVLGGQVYGTWPGIAPAQQVNGDLAVTTDVRDLFGEVATVALKNDDADQVVPPEPGSYGYAPIGFLA